MMAAHYEGWHVITMDIDPAQEPDIVYDALKLKEFYDLKFNAVHVSHLLEHFYSWQTKTVLEGIYDILYDDGMVDIYVPDIMAAARKASNFGIDAHIYKAPAGNMTFHEMLYGYGDKPEMAHHQGFDLKHLVWEVEPIFPYIIEARRGVFEIGLLGFKQEPTWQLDLFMEKEHETKV